MKESCNKEKCPHLGSPLADCYCSHMNSQMTEKTVKFCGGNYKECDIYKKHHRHEEPFMNAGI
jgi:hypothetical protein